MCAMMPMLRTLARAASAAATVIPTSSSRRGVSRSSGICPRPSGSTVVIRAGLPAVMREGLVGLGHLVRVLATLDGGAEAVARVEQLVHEALDHGLLPA